MYMSMKALPSLYMSGGLHEKPKRGRGLLQAADTADSDISPMQVRASAMSPLVFHPDNCVRHVTVRVICKFPYGLIIGASDPRAHKSIFDFGLGKDFKPKTLAS